RARRDVVDGGPLVVAFGRPRLGEDRKPVAVRRRIGEGGVGRAPGAGQPREGVVIVGRGGLGGGRRAFGFVGGLRRAAVGLVKRGEFGRTNRRQRHGLVDLGDVALRRQGDVARLRGR